MTNEEAIKVLKDYLYYLPELDFAAKVAIHAIERQIPKTPLNAIVGIGFVAHMCPNCESLVVSTINYCPDCGQRLNWEV